MVNCPGGMVQSVYIRETQTHEKANMQNASNIKVHNKLGLKSLYFCSSEGLKNRDYLMTSKKTYFKNNKD